MEGSRTRGLEEQAAQAPQKIDFGNTEMAFRSQTDGELTTSYYLLKALGYHTVVNLGPLLLDVAFGLRLPVKRPIKATLFKQFCGGESFEECRGTIDELAEAGIKTMLDYAVEARQTEEEFEKAFREVSAAIQKSQQIRAIRSCVVKFTGLARLSLLEKVSSGTGLNQSEHEEWQRAVERAERLSETARDSNTSVFIDAEESWIQKAIDDVTIDMMARYNRERAVVYGTVQMYRRGRLDLLEQIRNDARKGSYRAGIKVVRGAYLDKEQEWAAKRGVPPIVYTKKKDTDRDFDQALRFIVDNLDCFALCAATHNEKSTELLLQLMEKRSIEPADPRIEFSQLYGMGNHLTHSLAHHGYNASKYVPYGPVELVIPYLTRRAQENSSVHGTAGRELRLLAKEMERRGLKR